MLISTKRCPQISRAHSFAKTISSQCRSRDNNPWFPDRLPESLLGGYTYAYTEALHFLSISSFQIWIPRSNSFQKIPHKRISERENSIRKQSIKKMKERKQNETIKKRATFHVSIHWLRIGAWFKMRFLSRTRWDCYHQIQEHTQMHIIFMWNQWYWKERKSKKIRNLRK